MQPWWVKNRALCKRCGLSWQEQIPTDNTFWQSTLGCQEAGLILRRDIKESKVSNGQKVQRAGPEIISLFY